MYVTLMQPVTGAKSLQVACGEFHCTVTNLNVLQPPLEAIDPFLPICHIKHKKVQRPLGEEHLVGGVVLLLQRTMKQGEQQNEVSETDAVTNNVCSTNDNLCQLVLIPSPSTPLPP